MTEPTPEENGQGQGGGRRRAPETKPAPDLLDVVEYLHRDPILGGEHRAVGVVIAVDDQGLTILPVAHHHIRVDPSEVSKLTADDAGDV